MNRIISVFTVLFLSVAAIGFADEAQQVITLKDGSQIKGELAGIENGVYTIKAPVIGEVHVAANDVASITSGGALPPAGGSNPVSMDQQILAQQQKLTSNPQSMAVLQQMAQDPEIMQALSDPALVQAVSSHDYQAVQNNPKIQELMNNPKMQAYLKALAAQQQQNAPSQ